MDNTIIGSGDIAQALAEARPKGLHFFASGVSNSQETRESEYKRELDLLFDQPRDAHLVYFSSLSVFYGDTRYTRHKREMELRVKQLFDQRAIIRIGNITWGYNPHTLINYLRAHPDAPIRDEYRYVIDKDEFIHWINLIPAWNVEMNCPGQRLKVKEIHEKFVKPHTVS